ncbi:hypothetical protein GLI01_02630 [Gluconacetobacter liquefaciens]|uniref:Glycosyltransferase n=1 Tax=Gluconacetobacter liquefaciens TaxID=89584 RepID=A0A370G6Z8_GLULI|nr:glycosyltransferase [Gluconacetobacter liquefaciens]MBB2185781.1 glycosyltransferase [Gluconacetobacter liquefaciens]RDI39591.1 GT2 family glycosyltransferase [Gluconacetobacter liquefaciens]GEB36228.1 hypothetical protein GLI01_02630 [Gluconacetobacter liquefaciens]
MRDGSFFLVIRMQRGHGVSVTAAETARALLRCGHAVTIGCVEPSIDFPDLDVRTISPDAGAVAAAMRAAGADTVVALSAPYFDILPDLPSDFLRLAWEAGDPTPGLFPATEALIREGWALAKRRNVYPRIDGVMTVSEFLISDINWPDAIVVPNGADHAGVYIGKPKRADGPLRVGLLARLGVGEARYKGFDLVEPLQTELRLRNVNAVIEVMGRGTETDAKLLRRHGFKVHLNGTDAERATFLSEIDVFISLSLWEGFDLPIVEAQWFGTPSLALDTGAHPAVTPLLMPDLGGIADLLESYACDAALLASHGQLCRNFVATRFTWDATAERYLLVRERLHAAKPTVVVKKGGSGSGSVFSPSDSLAYRQWSARYQSLTAQDINTIGTVWWGLRKPAKVSILVDVSVGSQRDIACLFSSLLGQIYSHWEVLFFGTPSDARLLAATYSLSDGRIRQATPFTSVALALDEADGELVMCLDNGAALSKPALSLLVAAMVDNGDIAVVYADEDRIDEDGGRSDPVFKTQIDPDLLIACEFVGRGAIFRKDLLRQEAAWHPALTPAALLQATALKAYRDFGAKAFAHLPLILHHIGAAHLPIELHDLKQNAARFIEPCSDVSHIEPNPLVQGTISIRYPLPDPTPHVSIIVPTRDRANLLSNCIEGILYRTDYPSVEVIIVDNGSTSDESLNLLNRLSMEPRVKIISSPGPFNYAKLINGGVMASTGDILVLLNDDIEVIGSDWLTEMVTQAIRPGIGAVGAKLLYPDRRVQHAGIVLGIGWPGGVAGHMYMGASADDPGPQGALSMTRTVSAVTGACLVVRRDLYQQFEGLDEIKLAVDFNDVDFCLRLQEQGFRNIWTPFAILYHKESASRGKTRNYEQEKRFGEEVKYMLARWGTLLDNDPYWNPNLSLVGTDLALANPPRGRRPWEDAQKDSLPRLKNVGRKQK